MWTTAEAGGSPVALFTRFAAVPVDGLTFLLDHQLHIFPQFLMSAVKVEPEVELLP
jgi:hypothetical protein